MNNAAPLNAALQNIDRAREIVASIRAGANAGGNEALSQLDAVLNQTAGHIAEASRQFEQRLNELSSVVLSSNIRHF